VGAEPRYDSPRGLVSRCLHGPDPLHSLHRRARGQRPVPGLHEGPAGRGPACRSPALPLVLAALQEELGRGLLIAAAPRTQTPATQRKAHRGSSAPTGLPAPEPRRLARLGLEPPPHLVGERARALDCPRRRRARVRVGSRAREGMPPLADRPRPSAHGRRRARASTDWPRRSRARATSASIASTSAVSSPSAAGSSTSFPQRGASRLRVELFGDEIEQVRPSRPSPNGAAHDHRCADLPRCRAAQREPSTRAGAQLGGRRPTHGSPSRRPRGAVGRRPISSGSRTRCVRVWEEEGLTPVPLERRHRARPVPARAGIPVRGAAAGNRSPGSREAENELLGSCAREPRRRHVPASRRGATAGALLRKVENTILRTALRCTARRRPVRGLAGAARVRLARPRPRPAARHAGLPQAATAR
jgi:hypothetical protein